MSGRLFISDSRSTAYQWAFRPRMTRRTGLPSRRASTDRDRVDLCFREVPPRRATPVPFEKSAMPSPRREQPIYQGPRASHGTHPVRDRPSRRIASARTPLGTSQHWMAAIVMAGGGPEAPGRMQGSLVEGPLPARGRHRGFFGRGRMVAAEADVRAGTSSTRSRSVSACPRRGLGRRRTTAVRRARLGDALNGWASILDVRCSFRGGVGSRRPMNVADSRNGPQSCDSC